MVDGGFPRGRLIRPIADILDRAILYFMVYPHTSRKIELYSILKPECMNGPGRARSPLCGCVRVVSKNTLVLFFALEGLL